MKTILVLNAGSSSLKFALFAIEPELSDEAVLSGQIEGLGASPTFSAKDAAGNVFNERVIMDGADLETQHADALSFFSSWLNRHYPHFVIVAAGHRIVHGGTRFRHPVLLDETARAYLATLIPLVPLHQPYNLGAVEAVHALDPRIPQIGCFDTSFHTTQSALASGYALPRALSAEGIERYGFHGLSYDYVSRQLPEIIGRTRARGAVVVAHLGNGSSMCALKDMKSVATSLGFSGAEGLMMGTRTGAIDPGVFLYLMQTREYGYKELTNLVYKRSGLLGVSGISQDMRALLASDAPEAAEAVGLYCYRAARELGSLAAALGGLDALVFTAGIGERSAAIRARICELSHWLGIEIDPEANEANSERLEASGSRVAIAMVPTNEERMIARYTAEKLEL